jgi:hypothetical protein
MPAKLKSSERTDEVDRLRETAPFMLCGAGPALIKRAELKSRVAAYARGWSRHATKGRGHLRQIKLAWTGEAGLERRGYGGASGAERAGAGS